jgi:Mrp family chromosome partitioning ATPase/capsular polysaccharide biosynthesis protein
MSSREDTTLAGYVATLRRRKWIVILSVLVATASALFFASRQSKLYESSATVLLNPDPQLLSGAGRTAADAAARYDATQAQVAHTPQVASEAVHSADVSDINTQQLLDASAVSADATSNILTFKVSRQDPAEALALTNSFAQAFVDYRSATDSRVLDDRINQYDAQVRGLYTQLNTEQSAGAPTAATRQQISAINVQRSQLEELKLEQSDAVVVSERAAKAVQTQPKVLEDAIIGGLLGLVIGIALVSIREALDTRVRTSDEATDSLGLPLLARIPEPARSLQSDDKLSMIAQPDDPGSEAYRKLRVAFDFANLTQQARTVMVTSAVEEEGKSTTVANLAVALALAGRRVCLVDLDLRRPYVERFFGLSGRPGMTDAVLGHASVDAVAYPIVLADHPADTPSANGNGSGPSTRGALHVIPAGQLPPNPAEFLESQQLKAFIQGIAAQYDLLLIDSAPLVPVSDGVAVANQVDAMIIVLRLATMNRALIAELRRVLDLCKAAKLGIAATGAGAAGEYGYDYYSAAGSSRRDA